MSSGFNGLCDLVWRSAPGLLLLLLLYIFHGCRNPVLIGRSPSVFSFLPGSVLLGEPGERCLPSRSETPSAAFEAWVLTSLFSSHQLKILWRSGPLTVPGRWRCFDLGSERFSSALRHTGRPLLRRYAQFPDDAALVKAEESPGLMCQHTGLLWGGETLIPIQKHKLRAALYSSRPSPS